MSRYGWCESYPQIERLNKETEPIRSGVIFHREIVLAGESDQHYHGRISAAAGAMLRQWDDVLAAVGQ